MSLPHLSAELEKELVAVALEFRAAAPWTRLDNSDYLLVDDDEAGLRALSILGAGGQQYGLQSFAASCASAWLTMVEQRELWDELDPAFLYELLDGESLEFSSKTDTWVADRAILQRAGYEPKPRTRRAWPIFRAMQSGYLPWHPDEAAARRLLADMRRALRWAELAPQLPPERKTNLQHPVTERESATVPAALPTDRPWRLEDLCWRKLPPNARRAIPLQTLRAGDEATRSLPRKAAVWWWVDEGAQMMTIQNGPDERPYFPRLGVCLDGATGMAFSPSLVPAAHGYGTASRNALSETMSTRGFCPGRICVTNPHLLEALRPYAEGHDIRLAVAEPDEALEQFWWMLDQMPG